MATRRPRVYSPYLPSPAATGSCNRLVRFFERYERTGRETSTPRQSPSGASGTMCLLRTERGSPPESEAGEGEVGVGCDDKGLLEGEVRLGPLPHSLGAAPADHAARPLSFRAAVKVQLARVRLLEPVARRRRLDLTPSWRRTLAKPLCQARMALQHVVTLDVLAPWYFCGRASHLRHEPSRVSTAASWAQGQR